MNYLRQHWQGDHALARSFWLNWLVIPNAISLAYLIFFCGYLFTYFIYKLTTPTPLAMAVALIPLVPIFLFLLIWGNVGLWRATKRHAYKTQRKFWPTVVRVIIIINVCYFGYDMYTVDISQVRSLFSDKEELPFLNEAYALILSKDHQVLHVKGVFKSGIANAVEKIIQDNPSIDTIALESNGGLALEGIKLSRLIKENHINTLATTKCYSACTIAFISGKKRQLMVNTKLGFHKSSLLIKQDLPEYATSLYRVIENYYLEKQFYPHCKTQGINEIFIEAFKRTTADKLWFPSPEEMLDMGLIHEVVDLSIK